MILKLKMSDKVSGRGHKISPINGKSTKIAYSPCPKIDPDYLGIPMVNNGEKNFLNIFHAIHASSSFLITNQRS